MFTIFEYRVFESLQSNINESPEALSVRNQKMQFTNLIMAVLKESKNRVDLNEKDAPADVVKYQKFYDKLCKLSSDEFNEVLSKIRELKTLPAYEPQAGGLYTVPYLNKLQKVGLTITEL